MSLILLRTHGGLGNQIFQTYFALCCKFQYEFERVVCLHDDRYHHRFKADSQLQRISDRATLGEIVLSAIRIPKLARRIFRLDREFVDFGGVRVLDGYFQDKTSYEQFSIESKSKALSQLRLLMEIREASAASARRLEHIRLGDFFSNQSAEEEAARAILRKITSDSDIITNNEPLVRSLCAETDLSCELNILPTENMSGNELLHLMGQYEEISSNNSTLALWSALLYGRTLRLKSALLEDFYHSEKTAMLSSI